MHVAHSLLPAQQMPLPPPSSRTLDAARLDRGAQFTRVHLAPAAQRVSEEGTRKDATNSLDVWLDVTTGGSPQDDQSLAMVQQSQVKCSCVCVCSLACSW